MNEWTEASTPPPLDRDLYGWPSSAPVLVFLPSGCMRVATYERMDEGSEARWLSDDSERWDITERVRYWRPLPEAPRQRRMS